MWVTSLTHDLHLHYLLSQSPSKPKGTTKTATKRKRPQKSPTAKVQKQPSQPKKKRAKKDAKAPPPEFHGNRCDRCGEKFSCAAKIKEHIRVVHDRLMLSCQICNATMKWSSSMAVHLYTKHKIGDAPKKKEIKRDCVRCNMKFKSNKLLYEHLKSVHKEKNVFKCPKCYETFSTYASFFKHKIDHPELLPQELPQQCSVCHLRFSKVKLLVRHSEKYGHRTDYEKSTDQDLNCFKCHKRFSSYSSLSTHVSMTNTYKQCTNASRVCPPCKKAFNSCGELEKHMKAVHPNQGRATGKTKRKEMYAARREKYGKDWNKCEICGKVLADSTTMEYHLNMHKGVKNFKCDLCEYRASFPSAIRSHRKTHFGNMNFFCRTCGKGYKERGLWRACEFMHTGKAPHQCSLCKQQFVSDSAFKHHKNGQCKKKPRVTGKMTEHSSEEISEIVTQSGAQGGPVVDDNSSKTNATERLQMDEITNQAVRNLLMRGQKFAESVDETVIADFTKPKPKLPLPATVDKDKSGDKDACDTEIAPGPSTPIVAEDLNGTESMGDKLAEADDKHAEADDKRAEADNKLAQTADKSVKNIGESADKDERGDKAVCAEVTEGPTRQGDAAVKRDASIQEKFEYREVKRNTTILWREVTVEEVVKSINKDRRLARRRDDLEEELDLFNDIVFG